VEASETTSQLMVETEAPSNQQPAAASLHQDGTVHVESDLDFIRELSRQLGETFKKCMQCGTCSAVCSLSPDREPFPRKEMIWAAWGMKDHLLADPDVWLCYQCNDCSPRCPRGARPGDVLAAIRQQVVMHNAAPRFLGRWVNQFRYVPLLLALPIVLLGLAIMARDPLASALGFSTAAGEKIVYSYSSLFPHWMLNSFFLIFTGLVLLASVIGVRRFWRALTAGGEISGRAAPAKGLFASITAALKSVFAHKDFPQCTAAASRFWSHLGVFYGFLALTVVTLWVITSGINPLIRKDFIYPFGFWNPWKLLANLGGVAVLAGCILMIRDRFKESEHRGANTFSHWALLATLLLVVVTGFATEILHYMRLEPHRHAVYFVHLVFVFALLMYMPYSKLAHLIYRTTAMVYAERTGRKGTGPPATAGPASSGVQENVNLTGEGSS
jgi:quinone-modifying oxidoreductase subunit QmoC